MSITYSNLTQRNTINVYLDGKLEGKIRRDRVKGWYYQPLGTTLRSRYYADLEDVKANLEEGNE